MPPNGLLNGTGSTLTLDDLLGDITSKASAAGELASQKRQAALQPIQEDVATTLGRTLATALPVALAGLFGGGAAIGPTAKAAGTLILEDEKERKKERERKQKLLQEEASAATKLQQDLLKEKRSTESKEVFFEKQKQASDARAQLAASAAKEAAAITAGATLTKEQANQADKLFQKYENNDTIKEAKKSLSAAQGIRALVEVRNSISDAQLRSGLVRLEQTRISNEDFKNAVPGILDNDIQAIRNYLSGSTETTLNEAQFEAIKQTMLAKERSAQATIIKEQNDLIERSRDIGSLLTPEQRRRALGVYSGITTGAPAPKIDRILVPGSEGKPTKQYIPDPRNPGYVRELISIGPNGAEVSKALIPLDQIKNGIRIGE